MPAATGKVVALVPASLDRQDRAGRQVAELAVARAVELDAPPPAAASKSPSPPAFGSRPRSLSHLVLAAIAESGDRPISLRGLIAAVRAQLDRARPDLEQAVVQVTRDLRASGAIEAAGYEEYVVTEQGRPRA